MEVKVDETRHEEGLASPHGQAEKIIGVVKIMEQFIQQFFPIRFFSLRVVDQPSMQVGQSVVLAKLIQEVPHIIVSKIAVILVFPGGLLVVQQPVPDHLREFPVAALEFNPQIGLDSFLLRRAKVAAGLNISQQAVDKRLAVSLLLPYPCLNAVAQQTVNGVHGFPVSLIG